MTEENEIKPRSSYEENVALLRRVLAIPSHGNVSFNERYFASEFVNWLLVQHKVQSNRAEELQARVESLEARLREQGDDQFAKGAVAGADYAAAMESVEHEADEEQQAEVAEQLRNAVRELVKVDDLTRGGFQQQLGFREILHGLMAVARLAAAAGGLDPSAVNNEWYRQTKEAKEAS